MLKGLGDMAKMMKAAQEMQTKMAELQEDLQRMTVVGESGAGKSVTGFSIINLISKPGFIANGSIAFEAGLHGHAVLLYIL